MHIVIVEDNPSVAKGLQYFLQDAGHAVDVLHDGLEAENFLQDTSADMVVLDIIMIVIFIVRGGLDPYPSHDSWFDSIHERITMLR